MNIFIASTLTHAQAELWVTFAYFGGVLVGIITSIIWAQRKEYDKDHGK